jgi:hypothetical protein
MPKDFTKETGCFVFNTDLIYYELKDDELLGKLKVKETGRSKYLFYQLLHNIPDGSERTFSLNRKLKTWNNNRVLSEQFKITERNDVILKC